MKAGKIIKKAEEQLNSDNTKLKHKVKHLKKALKLLRSREQKLDSKINSKSVNRKKLTAEIAVVHAYRKKGVKQLKKLKKDLALLKSDKVSPDS